MALLKIGLRRSWPGANEEREKNRLRVGIERMARWPDDALIGRGSIPLDWAGPSSSLKCPTCKISTGLRKTEHCSPQSVELIIVKLSRLNEAEWRPLATHSNVCSASRADQVSSHSWRLIFTSSKKLHQVEIININRLSPMQIFNTFNTLVITR